MSKKRITPREIKADGPPSDVEGLKLESHYLRGTLAQTLQDPLTGSIPEADNRILKFHGSYMQDDRDFRQERTRQKLEPDYQFMLRVRAPGGIATPQQWLVIDELAQKYANHSIRLTTRQAFQLHGVLKWNLKQTIREINQTLLDTLAACGDVNRNVMCNPNPYQSEIHLHVFEWAKRISEHLSPHTRAYHEIWLDGDKIYDSQEEQSNDPNVEQEPIYGATYLPRKFKIGIAVPPSNDVDVYSQDLGLIAIVEQEKLIGFNVLVGGGMGMTYGDTDTYPQLGRLIGFCRPDQVLETAEQVVTIQRDYGNRSVRKYARLKYTIDRYGLDWFQDELAHRLGWELEEARSFHFDHNGDRFGWVQGFDQKWHLTLFIQSGRIKDEENYPLLSGLRKIASVHDGDFRLTANQNLVIGNISEVNKPLIEKLAEEYSLTGGKHLSALRRNSMACVALPTCGMAMAEAERYLPELLEKIEILLEQNGLLEQEIVIRMSGCPNGCARPALAELAFIGKAPGKYNMYLGGSFNGERLNKLYRENIGEPEILEELQSLFKKYAETRNPDEGFGDFAVRAGYVKAVYTGQEYHD